MSSTSQSIELPAAIDAEKSILGAVMLDDRMFDQTIGLRAEHFYLPGHRQTFDAMTRLREQNHPIDIITLTNLLKDDKALGATGGVAYIASLTDGVPRNPSIAQYVKIVKDKALARTLIHACDSAMSQALEQSEPIRDVLQKVETELFEAAQDSVTRDFADTRAIVQENYGTLEAFLNRTPGGHGLKTKFAMLDSVTGGLQPADLILLAARPSMGKTALAMNIAEQASLDGKTVGIFSLEMDRAQLLDRQACSIGKVNLLDFRSGYCDDLAKHRVQTALDKLLNAPIYIDDTPMLSIVDMRAKARKLARTLGRLDLLIVDYIQLMLAAKGRTENRNQEISTISRGLKLLARELKCPLLALSQLNRSAETRDGNEPKLSDLRDSGSLEQDADVVMLLYRPEYYSRDDESLRGKAKLNIAKQRNGPTDTVELMFHRQWARFENLEK